MIALIFIILGILCFFFAVRGLYRVIKYRIPLPAKVTDLQYQLRWMGKHMIWDEKSSVKMKLRFFWNGRIFEKEREYRNISTISASIGNELLICFHPNDESWILKKERHYYWILLLPSAVFLLLVGIALAVNGESFTAALSTFSPATPNSAGQLFYGIGSVLCGCLIGLFCIFLAPYGLYPISKILYFHLYHSFCMLEEQNAECLLYICCSNDNDSSSYYPIFAYNDTHGQKAYWHPKYSDSVCQYQTGKTYSLYRHLKTGKIFLKPTLRDYKRIPSAILCLIFLGLIIFIILGICAAMLVYVLMSL